MIRAIEAGYDGPDSDADLEIFALPWDDLFLLSSSEYRDLLEEYAQDRVACEVKDSGLPAPSQGDSSDCKAEKHVARL